MVHSFAGSVFAVFLLIWIAAALSSWVHYAKVRYRATSELDISEEKFQEIVAEYDASTFGGVITQVFNVSLAFTVLSFVTWIVTALIGI